MANETTLENLYDIYYREADLLFQRLNFFLISTAFLIAAMAAVLTSEYSVDVFYYFIVITGFVLSLGFLIVNCFNSLSTLRPLREKIMNLEEKEKIDGAFTILYGEREFIKSMPPGIHTILIPAGFLFFWIFLNLFFP